MHIPHIVIGIAVQTVIVVVPALVGTKFFIGTTSDGVAAIETNLFHSTKVLIKIQIKVFKRLQTTLNDYEPGISI